MKTLYLITIILAIILLLIVFYPLCNFHTIGTGYKASDGCNTCTCTLYGSTCTLMACNPAIPDHIAEKLPGQS